MFSPSAGEPLTVYDFLNAIEIRERLLVRLISEPDDEQKLPRGGHFKLNVIEKLPVFFEQFTDSGICFSVFSLVEKPLVVVKVLSGINAHELNVGLRGEKLCQLMNLLRDTRPRQNRDVCRRNNEVRQLAVTVRLDSIARKMFDTEQILR